MPDETIALKAKAILGNQDPSDIYVFNSKPYYNIDNMDNPAYMNDHRMEGVYTLMCKTAIDPARPGRVFIDGADGGVAIIGKGFFPGSVIIGLPVRRFLTEYGRTYQIRFSGAVNTDGEALPDFEFPLETIEKGAPGLVYPEHDELVLRSAREGAVLLKNENDALPLGKGAWVNAFGKGAPCYRLGCIGAGKINPRYGIRFAEGIRSYSGLSLNEDLYEYYRMTEDNSVPDESLLLAALEKSKTAVIVLTRGTGEAQDNTLEPGDYHLTEQEKTLLDTVSHRFAKTVVVLNTGYPIEMNWVRDYPVDAVLWSGLGGMAGGAALAQILEGTVCPSGRLPDTWAWNYRDYPSAANFYLKPKGQEVSMFDDSAFVNTVYEEGIYVGYRYFTTFGVPCAFPFGHGLSYTSFERTCVRRRIDGLEGYLDIRVTNTGRMAGRHSVLLFAKLPDGRLEQPKLRLIAFGKTGELAPGANEVVRLHIEADQLKSYDEKRAAWIVEPGTIGLCVGGSVEEAEKTAEIAVPEEVVVALVTNQVTPPLPIRELKKADPEGTCPTGKDSGFVRTNTLPFARERVHVPEKRPVTAGKTGPVDGKITLEQAAHDPELLKAFVLQLDDYRLCRMSVGARTGWGPEDNGFAGCLYNEGALEDYGISDYYMSDGNNGLNLNIPTLGFPVSNIMCATFDPTLTYEEGRAIAAEGIDQNLQCILAPAMNIHRNPLCGRHAEYFSEDPYLSGIMGGMQSRGIESAGLASVMKHLFANNAESYRNRNHSLMSERTAREIYLKVFETAFSVHMPDAVMTGYNPANGAWCAGDEELLENILRGEWGFTGYVMTDWGSSTCCPAVPTAQAGNSWVAPGGMDDKEVLPMVEALQNGTLDRERVRRNVYDMYRVIGKYL